MAGARRGTRRTDDGGTVAVEIGQPASSGIGGIPTRYVVIGAGVLGVGALLLLQGKKAPTSTDPNSGDVQPTGSVSAQLSSVQQMQLQQFGELTKLFAHQEATAGTQIGGLSAQLNTQAGALSSAINQAYLAQQSPTGSSYALLANMQQTLYYIFRRATDPTWQPGGSDDPYRNTSASSEASTQSTVSHTAA